MSDIAALAPWFHNLHLPEGAQTAPDHPLGDFPLVKWRQIESYVASDLRGQRVLDVGCNAGFYSFELARRGAEVMAIDIDPHYLRQAMWAADRFGLQDRIKFHLASVYDLAGSAERFDIVWFLGVLYHLRHPLLALDILRELTSTQMILQTLTMPGDVVINPPDAIGLDERNELTRQGWPCMAFIERELAGDPTNWWAPNHACVEAMLRSAGFRVTARPGHEIYLCEPDQTESEVMRGLREAQLRAVTGHRDWAPPSQGGLRETSSHSY
ncbi:MAG: TIGR04290 family methyltransferase [Sinobacteraceae bacterium]|nr:TIGR04290 family methyltransferase [Nevskiaceae bacterium]